MRLIASPGPPGFDGRGTPELDPVAGAEVITEAATGEAFVGVDADAATGEVFVGETDAAIGEAIVDATATADLVGAVVAVAADVAEAVAVDTRKRTGAGKVAGTKDGIEVRSIFGTDALQLSREKPHPE